MVCRAGGMLQRSGTTALNLLLGLDERLLCLGSMPHSSAELEVKVKRNIRCSCGDSVSDCVFWARFNGLVDSSDGDFCVEVMGRTVCEFDCKHPAPLLSKTQPRPEAQANNT